MVQISTNKGPKFTDNYHLGDEVGQGAHAIAYVCTKIKSSKKSTPSPIKRHEDSVSDSDESDEEVNNFFLK